MLSVALITNQFEAIRLANKVRVETSAQVVATQFKWVFEATSQFLRRIEETIGRRDGAQSEASLIKLASEIQNLMPGHEYAIFDASAQQIYPKPSANTSGTVAGREDFLRISKGEELVIAPIVDQPLDGNERFVMSRRIDHAGTMVGMATVSIPISSLSEIFESFNFSDRSTVSLVSSNGMLLARNPMIQPVDLSSSLVFEELKKGDSGSYESRSPADNVVRVVGFRKMSNWPVIAIAAIDAKTVAAGFWRAMALWSLIALPLIGGLVLSMLKIIQLIRDDEERQDVLAAVNERNRFLLREIHHRIKNNLQTVASLIRLQKMDKDDKTSLMGRIAAMVSVHQEMYQSEHFERVEVAPYLRRLAKDIAKGYGQNVEIDMRADEIALNGDRSMQLGLLFNELVSNAFKHAFAGHRNPKLLVRLEATDQDMVRLIVSDNGPGLNNDAAENMGSRLIKGFVNQLGATAEVNNENGVRYGVTFPRELAQIEK
jgi:two-component sensor histidine kinase